MEQEQIIEKIRKLHAKATGTDNVAEAAAFAEKVQALLLEHNLEMSQIESVAVKEDIDSYPFVLHTASGKGSFVNFHRYLLHRLAKYHFCSAIATAGTNQMDLVGEKGNVQFVIYLYEYLSKELQRIGELEFRAYKDNGGLTHGKSWKHSFYMGAVDIISSRLKLAMLNARQKSSGVNALVLASDTKLKEALARMYPNLYSSAPVVMNSTVGYAAGVRVGSEVSLSRPLTGKDRQPAKLNQLGG